MGESATARAAESGRAWLVGLAAALALGVFLRLLWPLDIEYKADEAWMFERAQEVGRTEPWPWTANEASVGIPNPGLVVWVFLALDKLSGADDPAELARAVQVMNGAALGLLVLFVWRCVPRGEREAWLWAAALVAVNPLAVLFHRKLWSPSVMPAFTVVMLAGWWWRRRRGGAFALGLVGMVLGQLHLSGFFFAAGFAAWALLLDRRRVAWRWWLAGCVVGFLPALPWVVTVLRSPEGGPSRGIRWAHALELKFWARWMLEPLGFGIDYTLEGQFVDFLRYPLWGGRPTYLVLALHAVLALAAVAVAARGLRWLWGERRRLFDAVVGRDTPSDFTVAAAFWGYGAVMTLSCCSVHRHYMVILFPLQFVWLARLVLPRAGAPAGVVNLGRALLLALCVSQALITANFLNYVHLNPAIRGEYGVAYGAQTDGRLRPGAAAR